MAETIKDRKNEQLQAMYVEKPPFPREFLLDVSSHCNHECLFCANTRMAHKAIMDTELVYRLLAEGFESGAKEVGLYATGEPFVAKQLPDFVAEAKRVGYEYVYITTNGAGAIPKRAKAVIDAGLDSVKFSIHAATRESYKHVHGKDDFDKVIENLKWVHQYRKETGKSYRIYVTMVQTKDTMDEIELLHEIVRPYIDEWDPHLLNNSCGTMPENNEIGDIESNNIRGRGHSDVCFQPFKSFTVTPEGLMSACVLDYHKALIVADLKEVSMKDAWHNEVYQDFRNRHLTHNTKGNICYNCINNTNCEFTGLIPDYLEKQVKPPRR